MIFLLWGFLLVHERRVRNKILIEKVKYGEFQVLDCVAYETSTSTDRAGTGVFCIYTKDGQYCWDRFRIDLNTVHTYQQGGQVPLLLVKCQVPGKKWIILNYLRKISFGWGEKNEFYD